MIKKRIIGAVIVKNGLAVQSVAYKNYYPLGKVKYFIENLDNWEADEIYLNCIDRSINNLGPDFNLMREISNIKITTPLIYGGGIRNLSDALEITKLGADRITLDSLLQNDEKEVIKISRSIGSQALIGVLPLKQKNKNLFYYNYIKKENEEFNNKFLNLFNKKYISELLISDYQNEGKNNSFNNLLLTDEIKNIPKIAFGGITNARQINFLFKKKLVNAVAIGNSLNFYENSIARIKSEIKRR